MKWSCGCFLLPRKIIVEFLYAGYPGIGYAPLRELGQPLVADAGVLRDDAPRLPGIRQELHRVGQ